MKRFLCVFLMLMTSILIADTPIYQLKLTSDANMQSYSMDGFKFGTNAGYNTSTTNSFFLGDWSGRNSVLEGIYIHQHFVDPGAGWDPTNSVFFYNAEDGSVGIGVSGENTYLRSNSNSLYVGSVPLMDVIGDRVNIASNALGLSIGSVASDLVSASNALELATGNVASDLVSASNALDLSIGNVASDLVSASNALEVAIGRWSLEEEALIIDLDSADPAVGTIDFSLFGTDARSVLIDMDLTNDTYTAVSLDVANAPTSYLITLRFDMLNGEATPWAGIASITWPLDWVWTDDTVPEAFGITYSYLEVSVLKAGEIQVPIATWKKAGPAIP